MLRATLIAVALSARAAGGELVLEVRDAGGTPVADAVMFAEPMDGGAPPVRPDTRAIIDQVSKEFVPRVSIVQAGTRVSFPNSDNIRHSIYSFSAAKTFTTKLYSGREAAPVDFDKAGLVVLGCNIHDQMIAWVYIVDTPWFAKSAADGVGTLRALPPGEYRVTIAAPATRLADHTVTLRIGGAPLRQSVILAAGH